MLYKRSLFKNMKKLQRSKETLFLVPLHQTPSVPDRLAHASDTMAGHRLKDFL